MTKWSKETEEIFYRKTQRVGACLLWTGSLDGNGYGKCGKDLYGKSLAHRAAYLNYVGHTDLPLDHLCRTRNCVELTHLEPVTHKENVHRGLVTRRTDTHCANGHPWTTDNRRRGSSGIKCADCDRDRQSTQHYRDNKNARCRQRRLEKRLQKTGKTFGLGYA